MPANQTNELNMTPKEDVKPQNSSILSSNDTFDDSCAAEKEDKHIEEMKKFENSKYAKSAATPAISKRRQANKHLVVQSPTDNIFSPCSQRLLRNRAPKPNPVNSSLID